MTTLNYEFEVRTQKKRKIYGQKINGTRTVTFRLGRQILYGIRLVSTSLFLSKPREREAEKTPHRGQGILKGAVREMES